MKIIVRETTGIFPIIMLCTCLTSCEFIEYHPYDLESDGMPSGLNRTNITKLAGSDSSSDTIRFIFMADTQRHYDETQDFVEAVNKRDDIDFVIHGGDITDFGMSKEYMWIYDIMKHLKVPFVALIGNHDVIGHGKDVYRYLFGDYNFAFVFRKTRFICLNTNALEFDYSTPVPDFDFMMTFINDQADVNHTVVAMHAPPNDDEFNNNSSILFNGVLEHYKNLMFCLNAHQHSLTVNDFFNNGILYYGCEDISMRSYLLFTLTNSTYSYTAVHF